LRRPDEAGCFEARTKALSDFFVNPGSDRKLWIRFAPDGHAPKPYEVAALNESFTPNLPAGASARGRIRVSGAERRITRQATPYDHNLAEMMAGPFAAK